MSKYSNSPLREQQYYNNNLNINNNNNLPLRGNQRIPHHQPSLPNLLKNEVEPRFSVSPNNQNKQQPVPEWLPNVYQPQQQQKQRDVSPNNILNKVCNDCSMRLFQERVLNQRIGDLQQQNQSLQKDLDIANQQLLQYVRQLEQQKNEIEQLKKKTQDQNIVPVQQVHQIIQPNFSNREPRSKSDNRSIPQNQQNQVSKSFKLFTCKLDGKNIESYYQNQQIHMINIIYGKQDPQWECLLSNALFQQNGLNYCQIQRKTQQDECYLLKGKINNECFSSIDEAGYSILPQLMAKHFLNLFYKDLKNRRINYIPQFIYSELFILQEIDKQQYWIAEKKYKEPYIKYNTRQGEICQNSNIENLSFLTAFSFFTYYTTYGNYMILDIQGYGQTLTEPTINSKTKKFLNDQGIDKIRKFLVKFQELKIGYKYLDALQMEYYK